MSPARGAARGLGLGVLAEAWATQLAGVLLDLLDQGTLDHAGPRSFPAAGDDPAAIQGQAHHDPIGTSSVSSGQPGRESRSVPPCAVTTPPSASKAREEAPSWPGSA